MTELRPQPRAFVAIAGVAVFCAVVAVSAWRQESLPTVARVLVVGGSGLLLAVLPYAAWRVARLRYLVTPESVTEVLGARRRTLRFADVTRVRAFRDRRRFASRAARQTLWLTGPGDDGREQTLRIPAGLFPTLRPVLAGLVPVVEDRPELFPVPVERGLLALFLAEAP